MLRRNFFATLLAPLVARFAPKPSPIEELCAALRALPPFWEFRTEYKLKYACAVGTGYWKQTKEWLDTLPQLDELEEMDA
jgi:hypothetical protein